MDLLYLLTHGADGGSCVFQKGVIILNKLPQRGRCFSVESELVLTASILNLMLMTSSLEESSSRCPLPIIIERF